MGSKAGAGAPASATPCRIGSARAESSETPGSAWTAAARPPPALQPPPVQAEKPAPEGGVARQVLLLPEVVELDPAEAERVAAKADELAALA